MIIYKIENSATGNVYIGQTIKTLKRRASQHISKLKNGTHGNPGMQRDAHLSGVDSFSFFELESVQSIELLDSSEREWIRTLKTEGLSLYNRDSGGVKGKTFESRGKGVKLKPHHVEALRASKKGKSYSLIAYKNAPKVPVCAVNVTTGEKHFFLTMRDCAKAIGVSNSCVVVHIARNSKLINKQWVVRPTQPKG